MDSGSYITSKDSIPSSEMSVSPTYVQAANLTNATPLARSHFTLVVPLATSHAVSMVTPYITHSVPLYCCHRSVLLELV